MKILGIDPGYAIVGYGVVLKETRGYRAIEHGAIITPAKTDFHRRLEKIYDDLSDILRRHQPDAVSIEKLFFQNNKTTAIGVAEARGVILLAAAKAEVPIFEYTPLQIKMAVTGYGRAQKPQMMEVTKRMLALKEMPKLDDTSDALAMAICHGQVGASPLKQKLMGFGAR